MPATLAVAGTALVLTVGLSLSGLGEEPAPGHDAAQTAQHAAAPARIRIPAIGVDASVVPLGLRDDGSLDVPGAAYEAGWWSGGARPGQPGPAVIVAHRDSAEGPAVFYEVPMLEAGSEVWVEDGRGRQHEFRVDRIERHSRDAFPTTAVYGPTERPTLRLLTCGGKYDPETGYADNYVVFASAVSPAWVDGF